MRQIRSDSKRNRSEEHSGPAVEEQLSETPSPVASLGTSTSVRHGLQRRLGNPLTHSTKPLDNTNTLLPTPSLASLSTNLLRLSISRKCLLPASTNLSVDLPAFLPMITQIRRMHSNSSMIQGCGRWAEPLPVRVRKDRVQYLFRGKLPARDSLSFPNGMAMSLFPCSLS